MGPRFCRHRDSAAGIAGRHDPTHAIANALGQAVLGGERRLRRGSGVTLGTGTRRDSAATCRDLAEPTDFDPLSVLTAFQNSARWGAISQVDDKALQSLFRSGIEIDDYQLDPVVRALTMPRVNLLIADDVGLGKAIGAGLIVSELLLRKKVREMVVACPPSMLLQW